jgi:hypothetical protein
MVNYSEFHDGSLDGLLIEGKTAYIFVTNSEKQRYVFVALDVLALLANEIREGNIILELAARPASDVTEQELSERASTHPSHSAGAMDTKMLERAREENLTAFTIDPSYGATCFVFAKSLQLLTYDAWAANHTP